MLSGFGLLSLLCGCNDKPKEIAAVPTSAASAQPAGPAIFEDVHENSGLDFMITKPRQPLNILETIGHGVGLIDYDNDGLLDVVLVGPDQVRLYKNVGSLKFQDVTEKAGLRQPGYWGGVAVGDYDNDGRSDLYLCGYNCSALYRNEGNGRFREVTREAGLQALPPDSRGNGDWRTSAGFMDLDRDGLLDLYVCRYAEFGPNTVHLCGDPQGEKYSCSPDIYKPQHGFLYRNMGGGKFKDITVEGGLTTAAGRALGVAFADYKDSGWVGIAIANDERPGDLFENNGRMRFINKGVASGTAFNINGHVHGGMGIDWGDYDQDGLLDLFVATYQNEAKSLYHNLGKGQFTDRALDAGLSERMDKWVAFGSKFFDYDRDGYSDLMVTSGHVINNTARVNPGTQYEQPVQLFHNRGGTFEEVTAQMGERARKLIVGRGLAVGDLDNDGRLDVVISQNEGHPMLLHNRVENNNRWISLHLVGVKSNRDGFGARVIVTAQGRRQVIDSSNAGSYMAASDSRLFFGLGPAERADAIEIRWPSGTKQTWKGLEANKFYRLTEGKPTAEVIR
jgi:hypothetical protein